MRVVLIVDAANHGAAPDPCAEAERDVAGSGDIYAPSMSSLETLTTRLRAFSDARDWHQFHTPKNLAMAIAGEAGELAAELQWLDGESTRTSLLENPALRDRVSQEMADVLIYLVRLADVAQIDLLEAAHAKVDLNETRFPAPGSTT